MCEYFRYLFIAKKIIFVDLRHVLTAAHCITELDGRVIHPDDVKSFANYLKKI